MTDPQPPARYKVGLVQMAMSADPDANLKKAVAKVSEAAAAGARLVCLPELFRSQYFAQHEDPALFDLAEPVPGPSTEALGKVAKQAGVVVIVPVFERRAAGLYHNSAAVIDADGRVLGIYRKMHIPDDPAYYEKFYFTPGDLGFRAFDTRVGRIGTLVCWDQWYPEGARLTALQGANVLLYPTAIGWHPKEKATHGAQQLDAWRTIQRSHAIANGCYVAAVNRVGHERPAGVDGDGIEFWGSSFLVDPFGAVVAEAPRDREVIVVGEIDLGRIEEVRRGWPFLRDRRIDAYAGIGSRFLGNSAGHERQARRVRERGGVDHPRVEFFRFPTNRGWTRDFGPLFVRRSNPQPELAIARFRFNAWAKYPDWNKDDQVPERVAARLKLRLFRARVGARDVVLEGGSIDVNGKGTLLTTEECLLDPAVQVRNPGLGRSEIEAVLRDQLGATNVLWLGRGIAGDDTHGHVDDLCRFVNPRMVVLCRETDAHDANYRALEENRERLQGMRLEDGSKIEVVDLPIPAPLTFDGPRLPASYAHFYVSNRT